MYRTIEQNVENMKVGQVPTLLKSHKFSMRKMHAKNFENENSFNK